MDASETKPVSPSTDRVRAERAAKARSRGILPPTTPTVFRRPVFAYGLAVLMVVIATALQHLVITHIFYPSTSAPFVAYYVAVMGAAWFVGLGPGLLTVALSGLAGKWFFVPPVHSLWVDIESADFLAICLFLALGMFFNVVCELARRAQAEAALRFLDAQQQRALAELESAGKLEAVAHLRASEERYLDLYDNAPDMMLSISAQTGDVVECNDTLVRELGYSRAQILGRSVYQLYAPESVQAARDSFRTFLEKGQVHNVELTLRRRDGSTVDVSLSSTAVYDAEGRIIRSRSVWRDITDRKRAEEGAKAARAELRRHQAEQQDRIERELERAREQLVRQARLAAIGQVSASIAHDLRNPLGVIQNAAFLLKTMVQSGAPIGPDLVEIVEEEVRTADQIITNLMDMTRAQEPRKETVELPSLIREIFEKSAPSTVELALEFAPDPFQVWADPAQLRQVFRNLIRNAIEAMDRLGAIVVAARRNGAFDEIEVRDTGRGVPAEIRERLFEPLVTTKAKGTGLGLLICRQILTRHGGSIELGASSAGGTTFCIRLPRQPRSDPGAKEAAATHGQRLEGAHC